MDHSSLTLNSVMQARDVVRVSRFYLYDASLTRASPERFRHEYRTQHKALSKCPDVYLLAYLL